MCRPATSAHGYGNRQQTSTIDQMRFFSKKRAAYGKYAALFTGTDFALTTVDTRSFGLYDSAANLLASSSWMAREASLVAGSDVRFLLAKLKSLA